MPVKIHDIGSRIHGGRSRIVDVSEVDHVSGARPGAKLDPALLLVEGEPGVVNLAGGGHQVRWDPGDLPTAI